MLKITAQLLVKEATARRWPVEIVDDSVGLLRITLPNGHVALLRSVVSETVGALQVWIADNKSLTYRFAEEFGVSYPKTWKLTSEDDGMAALEACNTIVIKPLDASHGHGVTVGVSTEEALQGALQEARRYGSPVLAQQYVTGDDYRLLYIGGELAAACIRVPAQVIGDGERTIKQLIELENTRPERGTDYTTRLNHIDIAAAERYLGERLEGEIPPEGQVTQVVGTANIGTGGQSIDRTADVPEILLTEARKMVDGLKMSICGVDFMYDKATGEAYFIELNVSPSFGLHAFPHEGAPQPVAKLYLDWLARELG